MRSRLAIVGSVKWPEGYELMVRTVIQGLIVFFNPIVVISGGAPGVDTWSRWEAKAAGIQVIEHLPEMVRPGENPHWPEFKARNLLVASNCTDLARIVSPLSTTYGSGWTRDRAKEMGRNTVEIAFK